MLVGRKIKLGFTLLELLIVISIIGILAAIVTANLMEAKAGARDAERQANIRELKNAIELYKNKYGVYPDGCNGTTNRTTLKWSGQINSSFSCADGSNNYIVGLAPEFISALPIDPKLNSAQSGYVYTTNGDKTVYKLKAMRTVETEKVDYTHPLKSCDIRVGLNSSGGLINSNYLEAGLCSKASFASGNFPSSCGGGSGNSKGSVEWQTSYGAWGGFVEKLTTGQEFQRFGNTTDIICR